MLHASKFSELGEMSAGLAHEINTPLGAITLSASQLKDLFPTSFENRAIVDEIIEDILSSSENISRIVRGMKNLSRTSTSEADVVFCNLSTIVKESVALCAPSLRAKKVDLHDFIADRLDVQCNPSQLSQVILNLVNNARDAIESLEVKWIKVFLNDAGDHVEIKVVDSGSGVPLEIQEKLFQPFFTTKEVGKGTGIGLSIAHAIVSKHRGDLFLEKSNPNTSFVVRLPKMQK